MSPGTYSPTGYDLDCMIEGEGFFLVGDKDTGDGVNSAADLSKFDLTRMGDFWVDAEGYVCDRRGKCLYGFATVQDSEGETTISTQLVPLRLPLAAAEPTGANVGKWQKDDPVYNVLSSADAADNNARKNYSVGGVVADAYTKAREWAKGQTEDDLEDLEALYYYTDAEGVGHIAEDPQTAGDNIRYPMVDLKMNGKEPTGVNKVTLPEGYNTQTGAVNPDGNGTPVEYTGIIPNGENKCIELKSMSINKQGAIVGTASNGNTVVVGYVVVANAAANDGVTHIDGYYYKAQEGAGDLRASVLGKGLAKDENDTTTYYLNNKTVDDTLGAPPTNDSILDGGTSEIRNGGLEASTTDIAQEFSNMILTQRGYQANTRIITVTDSMLEELVNMKR